jgi:hypothetical protein
MSEHLERDFNIEINNDTFLITIRNSENHQKKREMNIRNSQRKRKKT